MIFPPHLKDTDSRQHGRLYNPKGSIAHPARSLAPGRTAQDPGGREADRGIAGHIRGVGVRGADNALPARAAEMHGVERGALGAPGGVWSGDRG